MFPKIVVEREGNSVVWHPSKQEVAPREAGFLKQGFCG